MNFSCYHRIKMNHSLLSLLILSFVVFSCKKDEAATQLYPEANEELSGGIASVNNHSENAFGQAAPNLTENEALLFFVGNSFFNQNWVQSPASTTARDGLGPMMNARSCSGCHFKDGRGHVPEFDGETSGGLLLRLSISGSDAHGGPLADPNYGGQLQDMSIAGIDKEGTYSISYTDISGTFEDGTAYTLQNPTYSFIELNYGALDAGVMISPRVAPQMIGMGLLEAISEADILAHVDEADSDNDGISGKANYVWDVSSKTTRLGRFGWKANQPSLKQQVAGAFLGDMGITSSLFPMNNCNDEACDTLPTGGEYEIPDDDLDKVVLYSSTLAVPFRRNVDDQDVLKGKEIFQELKCNACHVQKYTTGTHPTFSALSNQTIFPYTDLLLHDMGDALADNRPDYLATGNEWRTPPLWGIGLFNTVNGHTQYLHDGRARNLTEAILWHGGEAESSKNEFKALAKTEREQLLAFLNSL